MAIKSSGTFLRFSEIASEFNDSQPHSMSEFTRGGILVPDAASNASIVSAAARALGGAGGQMRFSHYYGAANAFGLTIAATVTNLDLATLFNTAQSGVWADSQPKILTINSGIIIGATSTGNAALTIPSGMGGTLVIVNNGAIQGAGGASSGAAGGDAISVLSSGVSITNNGDIYAGGGAGGAGGQGGTGGNGSTSGDVSVGAMPQGISYMSSCNQACQTHFQNTYPYNSSHSFYCNPSATCYIVLPGAINNYQCMNCMKVGSPIPTYGTAGGAGGNGGVGQGYNQAAGTGANGVAGTSPPTNAGQGGTGGTGGAGGSFGTSGTSGTQGTVGGSGTVSNGLAGAAGLAGGAAGNYINGLSNVTFTNNGNTAGTTNP